jgi:O-antigen ligase
MLNVKQFFGSREMVAASLVFLFPLFANSLRHWVAGIFILLALLSLFSIKRFTYDLNREEKIFLAILLLHVLSTILSNALAGWTYASHKWFFSGDIRFIFAIPIYLYIRKIPDIWKYLVTALPFAAIIIGVTGVVDFMLRYHGGDIDMIFAEGVYGHIYQGNIAALWSVLSYLAIEFFKENRRMQMLCLTGAVLGAVGALVSVTRNAWLSLLLLYLMVFLLQGGLSKIVKTIGWRKITVVSVALISALYFMSGFEYVNDRLKQVYQEPVEYFQADKTQPLRFTSIGFRLEQWRGVLLAFEEKPLFGHGVGNSGKVHNRYIREGRLNEVIYQEPTEKTGSPSHVHSAYFEYLGDTGIVGFIMILLVLFYAPYLAYRSRGNGGMAWKFVIVHGAAFGIASITEVPFIRNNWTSVFLILCIVFFIWLTKENEKHES